MQNICGKDGGFIPIAKGPLDLCRGRTTTEDNTRIKVYVIKTTHSIRKNTTIRLRIPK
jgi:hypothetical protein